MLQKLFLTLVFFTLSHFALLVVLTVISILAIRYFYVIWNDQAGAAHERHISLIILICLVISLLLFVAVVIYVSSIFLLYLPELRKLMGK
jgi:hypothetical protein